MNAIRVESLTKKYKDKLAVDNVSFEVKKGELFSLLGVNGAGKTTTIKMLSCLISSSSGDAFINDKSINFNSDEVKKIIAISPQETAVAEGLTVKENLSLICGLYNFSKEKCEAKIKELCDLLGLCEILDKRVSHLSGGWKRRLSIAMALISEPEVLFLDEPTLGLDVIVRSELWDIIRGLKDKVTIILTTHYMEEAEALSDRVGIMLDGKLLLCGTPEEIKNIANANTFESAFVKIVKGEIE